MKGEPTASLGVEDGSEHAAGIQVREAEPVDGAVQGDQRDRAAVADDGMVSDWRVAARHRAQRATAAAEPRETIGHG